MNNPIMLSPQDIVSIVLSVCGALITLSAAATVIIKLATKAKEPEAKQNERISALEEEVKRINIRLDDGDEHFRMDAEKMEKLESTMKETNKIVIESLRALTAHAIDGNGTEALKESKQRLDDYLLNRL